MYENFAGIIYENMYIPVLMTGLISIFQYVSKNIICKLKQTSTKTKVQNQS